MTTRGRPPKNGPRYPCGKLKVITKEASSNDDAGRLGKSPLGILYMRSDITKRDYDVATEFGKLYASLYGKGAPRSSLQLVIGSSPAREKAEKWLKETKAKLDNASDMLVHKLPTHRPYRVLVNLAVYEYPLSLMDPARRTTVEAQQADKRDIEALKEATQALAEHWGLSRPKIAAA